MGRKLSITVYVPNEPGEPEAWGPGTKNGAEPPPEVAERITNPDVWAEETEDEAPKKARSTRGVKKAGSSGTNVTSE